MKKLVIFAVFFSIINLCFYLDNPQATNKEAGATVTEGLTEPLARLKSWDYHQKMAVESLFKNLKWMTLGPTFMGGRISSIKGVPGNNFTIYVSAGAGNLWKTMNNGTTWEPIFDNESTFTIGDIAVAKSNPNIIWVGSGEELTARSSYAGTGVFKSIDEGRTWQNMGLNDTQHIGRIVIDPENPDIVYVAAIGHNFTFNDERGLFKTTDGGKTWNKILYVSENVGVVEVVIDPSDDKTLYAATWERDRKPWINVQSGEGSGIYKTTDAGLTWKRLTNGFPVGRNVGRIGLDVSASSPNVVYALLDNHALRTEKPKKQEEESASQLTIHKLEKMTKEELLIIEPKILEEFLRTMGVPAEYTPDVIMDMVRKGELTPKSFAEYLLELWPDRKQFINVIGGEVYRSDDKGKTWKKMSEYYLDDFFNNYGYAFCDIRVSPDHENKIYILGVRLLTSDDGGRTFTHAGGKGVHADHHALWIDPDNPDRLLNGNDGGVNFSYDRGKTWQRINNLPIGEFYTVSVDMNTPYNIYGGLQDTGVLYGPSTHILEYGVDDPWRRISGGDGMFVWVDPTDSNIVYYGIQFGRLRRKNLKDGSVKNIEPKAKIGDPPLRYNWMTPYIISPHNPYILYFGANKLFKSLNKGDRWVCISSDLTTDPGPEKQGDIPYGTITTISESPLTPGLIYIGADDGNVQVTQNDGVNWTKISDELPDRWVSRVVASLYDKGTVFVSLTGFREDDFEKYLFMSNDYGSTWVSIAGNLPSEPINVIREDPKKKNILYVGTDLGVYVSLDGGKTWHSLSNTLPTTPVSDLVIHPRENELVIGTHGRSMYKLDVEYVQEFTEEIGAKEAHLFGIKPGRIPRSRRYKGERGEDKLRKAFIYYYLKTPQKVKVNILDDSGKLVKRFKGTEDKGINLAVWDLTFEEGKEVERGFGTSGMYVEPGNYKVEISGEKIKLVGNIEVKPPLN
jgi:photosystem II stability/assembly factor-like uncharacterized protein